MALGKTEKLLTTRKFKPAGVLSSESPVSVTTDKELKSSIRWAEIILPTYSKKHSFAFYELREHTGYLLLKVKKSGYKNKFN